MQNSLYSLLCSSGGYALPYLLELKAEGAAHIYLVNNNADIVFTGRIYKASTFEYTPNEKGEGSLKITVLENSVINLLESNYNFSANIAGVMLEDGTIQEIKAYTHLQASATWNEKEATISFESDDRLSMTFPSLIWTSYNNRSNS